LRTITSGPRTLGDRDRALDHALHARAITREAEYSLLDERTQAIIDNLAGVSF
jgi:hypothetical protein